jgi:hypothetical protein
MTWHEVQEVAVIAKQLLVLSQDPAILSYTIFEVGTKACSMFLIVVLNVSPSSTTSHFADKTATWPIKHGRFLRQAVSS